MIRSTSYLRSLPTAALLLLGACSASDMTLMTGVAPDDLAMAAKGTSAGITATRLPSLGKGSTEAFDVNDNGVIVGTSKDATGVSRPVRWTKIGGSWAITAFTGAGVAEAINVYGVAAGHGDSRALAWRADGSQVDLGPGRASGINKHGVIIGVSNAPSQGPAAWWPEGSGWSGPLMLPKLPGGGWAEAFGISDNNVAVGHAFDAAGEERAVRWTYDSATGRWSEPTVLFGLNGNTATGINANGSIVGSSPPCTDVLVCNWNAAVWEALTATTQRRLIPGLDGGRSIGMDIDDTGAIVGTSGISTRPFWAPSGATKAQELAPPKGLSGGRANGMNNTGMMVGGSFSGSTISAVVWTRSS